MEQRPQSLSPENLASSDAFISADEIERQNQNAPNPFQRKPVSQNSGIPDLHTVDINSTPQSRAGLGQKAALTTANLKSEIIDENIRNDIASAKTNISVPIPNNPKDILKRLIAKGNYEETVDLFGSKWTFRALDQRDIMLAIDTIKEGTVTNAALLSSVKFATVIFSIEAVDGKSIYEWFSEIKVSDFTKREDYLLEIRKAIQKYFEHMPPQVIEDFYTEYDKVAGKRDKAVEELKNS